MNTRRKPPVLDALLIGLVSLLLVLVSNAPALRELECGVLGDPGDNLGTVRQIDHLRLVLSENLQSRGLAVWKWSVPFGPEVQPATDYPAALLSNLRPSNNPGAWVYNILLLAAFPLGALSMYLLAYEFARTRAGAALAGLGYAFSAFHTVHARQHLDISSIQWAPLFLWALLRLKRRPCLQNAVLTVLCAGLVFLSSYYLAYIMLVFTAVLVLLWAILDRGSEQGPPLRWLAWLAAAALLLALVVSPLLFKLVRAGLERAGPPEEDRYAYSARLQDYLLPQPDHAIFSRLPGVGPRLSKRAGVDIERGLYIGWVPLLLAGVSLVTLRRRKAERGRVLALAIAGLAAVALSGPPVLKLAGMAVPLPNAFLGPIAPMFRAVARFGLPVLIAALLLAADGLRVLMERRPRRAWAIGALAIALVLVDLGGPPRLPLVRLDTMDLYRWLDANLNPGEHIIDYPLYEYRYLDHSGADFDLARRFAGRAELSGLNLSDLGDPKVPATLAALRIAYVLRHTAQDDPCAAGNVPAGLEAVRSVAEGCLLKVTALPALYIIRYTEGFSYAERFGEHGSHRWMGDYGVLYVQPAAAAASPDPAPGRLCFTALSLGAPRTLTVSASGLEPARFEVSSSPARFCIDDLAVPRAGLIVLLTPEPGAVTADSVTRNGDMRRLSIAVADPEIIPLEDGP